MKILSEKHQEFVIDIVGKNIEDIQIKIEICHLWSEEKK